MAESEPVFNAPRVVVVLLAIMVGVHVLRGVLDTTDSNWLVLAMAFIPARYAGLAQELPGGEIASVTSFLTHTMVHGDLTHLMFNGAWLLAFGSAVAIRIGWVRFLVFFSVCAIAGALAFLAINPGRLAPVVGASGAIAGLMGGTMRFLFSALDNGGLVELRETPELVRLMSLREALADRRVQITTAIWLVLNGLAILGFGGAPAGMVAWEAHIGGYFAGLLLFGLFDMSRRGSAVQRGAFH